jgi:murein DD-endopeptidase MepM/ murein hydrolase activator NlpD
MADVAFARKSRGLWAVAAVLIVTGCGTAPVQRESWTGGGVASPAAPKTTAPAPATAGQPYVFPVGGAGVSYHATHAGYPATDIFAACGSPVRAVTDGAVLEVSRADRYDFDHPNGARKGGLFVSLRGDDGVRYYGSHLSGVVPGLERGVRVRAGEEVGTVGRTGDTAVCHLHFGISPPCRGVGDWWIRRGEIWPASFLDAWRAGVALSPVDRVVAWQRANGCPAAPPN